MGTTHPLFRDLGYWPRICPTRSLRPTQSVASSPHPNAQGVPPLLHSFSNKVRVIFFVMSPFAYCSLPSPSCSVPSRTKPALLNRITSFPGEYDDPSPLHLRYIEKRAVCPIAIQTTVYLFFSSGSQVPFASTTVAAPRSTGIPGDNISGLLIPSPNPNANPGPPPTIGANNGDGNNGVPP